MNTSHRLIVSSALGAALALGLSGPAAAAKNATADAQKEKCFGIAKAGQNDCANLSGTHSCAGQSRMDMGKDEWKYVAKGSCMGMKGLSEAEAKAMQAKKS